MCCEARVGSVRCVCVSGLCRDDCSLYPDQSSSLDSKLIPLSIDFSSFSSDRPLPTNPPSCIIHHHFSLPCLFTLSHNFFFISLSFHALSFFFCSCFGCLFPLYLLTFFFPSLLISHLRFFSFSRHLLSLFSLSLYLYSLQFSMCSLKSGS